MKKSDFMTALCKVLAEMKDQGTMNTGESMSSLALRYAKEHGVLLGENPAEVKAVEAIIRLYAYEHMMKPFSVCEILTVIQTSEFLWENHQKIYDQLVRTGHKRVLK